MSIRAGTHKLGPKDATLRVQTGRGGAAAKAGHDLLIEVGSWEASLEVGEDSVPVAVRLGADCSSFRVERGTGGVQELSEDDREEISHTIDTEVLKGMAIEFRSTGIEPFKDGKSVRVGGDLEMAGETHPADIELAIGPGGRINGAVTLKQTDWGIKPYSALFGALKVADEVEVLVEGAVATS